MHLLLPHPFTLQAKRQRSITRFTSGHLSCADAMTFIVPIHR